MIGLLLSALPWTGLLLAVVALIQTARISRIKEDLKEAKEGWGVATAQLVQANLRITGLELAIQAANKEATKTADRIAEAQAAGLDVMNEAAAHAAAIMRGEA